jgi:uncharacterized protein involved in exopolysaccharide biosynthesis
MEGSPILRFVKRRWLAISAAVLSLAGLLIAPSFILPREYFASAVVAVRMSDMGPSSSGAPSISDPTDVIRSIRSREILEPVIKMRKLERVYFSGGSKATVDDVYASLRGDIALRKVRQVGFFARSFNSLREWVALGHTITISSLYEVMRREWNAGRATVLVRVGVYHADPEVAANVTNSIAVTLVNLQEEALLARLDQLSAELKDRKDRARQLEAKIAGLREELSEIGSASLAGAHRSDSGASERDARAKHYADLRGAYLENQREISILEARWAPWSRGCLVIPPVRMGEKADPPETTADVTPFRGYQRIWRKFVTR